MMMTIRRAKKINDSFIMTFNTTSIAPKKRIESRYRSSLIQNIGAEKAIHISIFSRQCHSYSPKKL